MPPTRLAALALAATTLVVCGCGESTKSSSNKTTSSAHSEVAATLPTEAPVHSAPLTRAQFITKADTICYHMNTERAPLSIRSPGDYARVVPQMATYQRATYTELSKLVPPAGARTLAESITKVGQYAQTNNITTAHPLLVMFANTRQLMRVTAKRDGFKDCALI
jgi:hypothetical protein